MNWILNNDFTVQRIGNDKIFANSVATVVYRLTGDILVTDIVNINLLVNGITYNYNMILDTDGSFYAVSNGDELSLDNDTETEMLVSFEIKKLSMLDNETVVSTQTTQQVVEYIYPSSKYTPSDIASDADKIYAEIGLVNTRLVQHISNKNNPHEVTKEQVGLGNADNTQDSEKPVSNPQKTYIDNAVASVPYVADFNYNAENGVLGIRLSDGTEFKVDLPLELIIKSGYYDYETYQLVLTLANGEEIRIALEDITVNKENTINNTTVNYTYTDIDGVKYADYIEFVIPNSTKLFDNVRYTFNLTGSLKWTDGFTEYPVTEKADTPVYVKWGNEILELKTPYDYNGRCIAEYIKQLKVETKDIISGYNYLAYRFSAIKKHGAIYIDMENLNSIKEYISSEVVSSWEASY